MPIKTCSRKRVIWSAISENFCMSFGALFHQFVLQPESSVGCHLPMNSAAARNLLVDNNCSTWALFFILFCLFVQSAIYYTSHNGLIVRHAGQLPSWPFGRDLLPKGKNIFPPNVIFYGELCKWPFLSTWRPFAIDSSKSANHIMEVICPKEYFHH